MPQTVPKELRQKYNNVLRSSGKAAANQWLADKQFQGKGRSKSRGARKAAARRPAGASAPKVAWSREAVAYAKMLTRPSQSPSVPWPVHPILPVSTFRSTMETTFSAGTNGVGFIVLKPQLMAAWDWNPVSGTDPAYTGTSAATFATAGTGVTTYGSPSVSYVSTGWGDTKKYRLTACEMTVTYMGRADAKAGRIRVGRSPLNTSVITTTISTSQTFPMTKSCSVHEAPEYSCIWLPADEIDFDFNTGTDGEYCMFAWVEGAPAASQDWAVRVTAHFEGYGHGFEGTCCIADPAALEAITTAANTVTANRTGADIPRAVDPIEVLDTAAGVLSSTTQVVKNGALLYMAGRGVQSIMRSEL